MKQESWDASCFQDQVPVQVSQSEDFGSSVGDAARSHAFREKGNSLNQRGFSCDLTEQLAPWPQIITVIGVIRLLAVKLKVRGAKKNHTKRDKEKKDFLRPRKLAKGEAHQVPWKIFRETMVVLMLGNKSLLAAAFNVLFAFLFFRLTALVTSSLNSSNRPLCFPLNAAAAHAWNWSTARVSLPS